MDPVAASRSEEYSVIDFLVRLWGRKWQIVAIALLITAMTGVYIALFSKPYYVQTLLRIEAEASNTGTTAEAKPKDANLETETSSLSSRSMIAMALEAMGPSVDVVTGETWLQEKVANLLQTEDRHRFPAKHLGLTIEKLLVPDRLLNKKLTLSIGADKTYTLTGPDHDVLFSGTAVGIYQPAAVLAEQPAGGDAEVKNVEMVISHLAVPAGRVIVLIARQPKNFIGSLQNQMKVEALTRKEDSGFIRITIATKNVPFATSFLTALVDNYVKFAYDRSALGKIDALQRLDDEAKAIEHQLEQAETSLTAFQQANHTVDTTAETQFTLQRLLDLQTQLSRLKAKQKEDSAFYTSAYPAQIALADQITYLQAELADVQTSIKQMPETERQLFKLKRDVESLQQSFTLTADKATQLRNEVSGIRGYAKIVDPPELVWATTWSSIVKKLLISFAGGTIIGAMLVYLVYFSPFAWIARIEQLATLSDLPLIGTVSHLSRRQLKTLPTAFNNRMALSDKAVFQSDIERLERDLTFSTSGAGNNIRLFTSLGRRQGVTLLTTFLAASQARRQRTILIDCNILRRDSNPYLAAAPAPGLSDVIIDMGQLGSAVRRTSIDNLWFLPAGTATTYGAQLLDRGSFRQLLLALSQTYECVILNYPPLADPRDFNATVAQAGAVFYIVRARQNVERVRQFLRSFGGFPNVKGTILNNLARHRA